MFGGFEAQLFLFMYFSIPKLGSILNQSVATLIVGIYYFAEAITDAHIKVAMLRNKFKGYPKMKVLW